eukprot:3205690-Karenia_brevis.AAC.1
MTADRERKLRSVQRRMLRCMVRVGRRTIAYSNEHGELSKVDVGECSEDSTEETDSNCDTSTSGQDVEHELENYVDWIRRATHIAENAMSKAKVEDWVSKQRRLKWSWAGHIARRQDHRWSSEVLTWTVTGGYRMPGHPVRRWQD